ncbi:MAG: Uma2 family endonuclease [Gomphosphaeria aponina SAG 52.96 = DSM 107014]|uniref:Uma2 family endonuclease n=1 Tax=Gomphosphaeria aponina SAG 52.96 = DSM 107014 TaxID=1521640 RepID=A0A941JPW1_9CHRO|nr:Uma2 family endonuclease [Gomphosphaeria aponina SAG 52.96 = DSM 107014]
MIALAKWSVEDYHQIVKTGIMSDRRVELLDGKILEMSPEAPLHRRINDSVAEYLRDKFTGVAKVYESHPITLTDSEPEPDIALVKLPVSEYKSRHPYPSDIYLLIEISDTTLEKDLNQKQNIYAQAGILEYWVIDVKAKKLIVFQNPSTDNYELKQTYRKGEITTLAFEEISLSVTKLIPVD